MSFINNKKDNIISLKMTDIGRKKIANGTLNYSKWALGDSEINYERELFQEEEELNIPPKILLPADVQPNLKYFITSDSTFENVKSDIVTGDIDLMKITTKALSPERGLTTTQNNTSSFVTENIKMKSVIKSANISGKKIIIDSIDNVIIGDLIFMENPYITPSSKKNGNSINYRHYSIFRIVNVDSTTKTITLNRTPKKNMNIATFNAFIYDGREVGLVPQWNTDDNIVWNGTTLNYDLNQNTIENTKPWSYNIVTLEQLAGYLDYKKTIGDKYLGLIENYLSYNDDLNNPDDSIKEVGCSEKLINGVVDKFKKILGVIHFENGHHTNMYGDSFYLVDNSLILNLPTVMHYSTPENEIGLKLVSDSKQKTLFGTEIIYHDLTIIGTNTVVGKVFPHFKIIIIEDEEINTAMSVGSGRNYTLPPLSGKLVTDSSGILPSGKQIYVTYTFRDKNKTDVFHCNKYLVVSNTTTTAKNVELKFENINDFVHMINPNVNDETGYTSSNFEIIHQITNIGDRPLPEKWVSSKFTNGLLFRSELLGQEVLNPIALTQKSFILDETLPIKAYSSIEDGFDVSKGGGLIGDETVLLGSVITSISSIIYKSLIQIRINTNLFKYTTNPTKIQPQQQPIVSEIGIYDSEDELVMIAKLSNPIQLSTRSSILLELSMDF